MFNAMKKVLLKDAKISQEELQKINPYLFCRWLSGSPYTIQAANTLNLYDIPVENQFRLVNKAFGGKIRYIPFPKSTKAEPGNLEVIARHFKINQELAKEYVELMPEAELTEIINLYQ